VVPDVRLRSYSQAFNPEPQQHPRQDVVEVFDFGAGEFDETEVVFGVAGALGGLAGAVLGVGSAPQNSM
jgi:hypothetical protein